MSLWGNVFHFLAHTVQSIILKGTHVRPEVLSFKGFQNGNIRASILFPLSLMKIKIHLCTLKHFKGMQNEHEINAVIMKLLTKEA